MTDVQDVVGTATDWEPFTCERWRTERIVEASGLTAPAYLPGEGRPELVPPTFLSAQYVDAFALGIPDAPARLNGGNSFRWLDDVRVGDELERRSEVTNAQVKEGRSGRLEIYTVETVYRRAGSGSEVARLGYTPIRRYPHDGADTSDSSPRGRSEVPAEASKVFTTRATPRQTVRYAVATEDLYEAHYDLAYAKQSGLPGTIVHGLLKMAWLARGALEVAGPDAVVVALDVSYRGMDLVGEDFTVWADSRQGADGRQGQQMRLFGTSIQGAITTVGTAEVRLASY